MPTSVSICQDNLCGAVSRRCETSRWSKPCETRRNPNADQQDTHANSVFTHVFAREMHTPGLSLDRIVRNVRSEVVKLARSVNHDQVPTIYDQVVGEYFFIQP